MTATKSVIWMRKQLRERVRDTSFSRLQGKCILAGERESPSPRDWHIDVLVLIEHLKAAVVYYEHGNRFTA